MDPKRLGNAMLGLNDYTTADVLNQPIRRGAILPWTEYADRSEFDLSSGITGSMGSAITAPARAYRGEMTDDQMIDEGANLAGWLTLGGYMSPKPVNALGAGGGGIKAFHGSPHDFDKFDMSKIGTGEGAQAYGHGLYFAEAEDVARSYRDSLSKDGLGVVARGWLRQNGGDLDKAIAYLRGRDLTGDRPFAINNRQALSELEAAKAAGADQGHMYEVRINADPADFLDWDKPLSQQSEKVRGLFNDRLKSGGMVSRQIGAGSDGVELFDVSQAGGGSFGVYPKEKVQSVLERPVDYYPNSTTGRDLKEFSGLTEDVLREAGIPGIRYLDQGSRGAGEGSSNYVVFDDALIEIMRKYGLLGPVAAGTVAAATNDEGPIY